MVLVIPFQEASHNYRLLLYHEENREVSGARFLRSTFKRRAVTVNIIFYIATL